MRNRIPEHHRLPWDCLNLAVATACHVCGWRNTPDELSLNISQRISLVGDVLTVYGITCEEECRLEYDVLERKTVRVTRGEVARSTIILASFSEAGEVFVKPGTEHCLRLLIPCLVVASRVFPRVCYEVEWKRLVPPKILGRAKKTIRLHNEPGWKKEACVCVAQNGQLLVDSPGLQDLISFRDFFDD